VDCKAEELTDCCFHLSLIFIANLLNIIENSNDEVVPNMVARRKPR